MERSVQTALALLLIIVLSAVILYAVLPYINYFLGSFILYAIFKPLYHSLLKRTRFNRQIVAVLVIVISIFLILIPFYLLLSLIISEIQQLLLDREAIIASIQSGNRFVDLFFSRIDLSNDVYQAKAEEKIVDLASEAVNYLSILILGSIQNISRQVIGFLIMYFLFYYLLTGEDSDFLQKIFVAVPFSKKNTITLLEEFRNIVRTTLIASGAIALIEGGILAISFFIFGIQGAFLWGSVAAILSFLPVVGTPMIWVPAIIVQLLQKDYIAAIGILVTGIFITAADNSFFRPIIQKKVGKLHPFQSLLGIVIGVSLFGLVGIIIGPLLLAYFYLTVKMFSEEYLSDRE